MTRDELATTIVEAVLADLHDRQGVGDVLDRIRYDHKEVYQTELLPELRATVKKVLVLAETKWR